MEITRVRSRVLDFPLDGEFRPAWMRGHVQTNLLMTLVEVETDEGLIGYGAADGGEEVAIAIERLVAPSFLGRDPTRIELLTQVLRDAGVVGPPVYCMEIPLWDIIGRLAEMPVFKLWGGHDDKLPAYCATGELRSPEQHVADVQALADDGFRAVKLRLHRADPDEDLAVVEAVRDAVGDGVELIVDANQAGVLPGVGGHEPWDFRCALHVARRLEELEVLWLEEPLERHDYDGLSKLPDRLYTLAIAGGECNKGLHEFRLLIANGCYDILHADAVISEANFQLSKAAALAET